MTEMKMWQPMFRIRNFGNDVECADLSALAVAIQRYRGKSVSIIDLRADGTTLYVDVSETGVLTESYGQHETVDLASRFGVVPREAGRATKEAAIHEEMDAIADEGGALSVTVELRIYDARAFRRAAYDRALRDGLDHQQASEYLNCEKMSLGQCGMMLIDPGMSPDGASIEGSSAD